MPYSLWLLGGASLKGPDGPLSGYAAQRRQLALLALLASAGERGCSRDKLLAFVWPDATSKSARHLLSDAVYRLRKSLGQDAIAGHTQTLRLNHEIVRADIIDFEILIRADDLAAAADLYNGPFLDGFHLRDSTGFEQWKDSEARRLDQEYQTALATLADRAEAGGDNTGAMHWLRRLLSSDPFNSQTVMRLMELLAAGGDAANAIKLAAEHRVDLAEQLGVEAPAELLALAERLRTAEDVAAKVPATAAQHPAIAVLPFTNMSADPENEYLSDGISEEILNSLTRLPDLRVAARTSSFAFKGRNPDIGEVGAKLHVQAVLQGSVRKSGNRLRITTQLIDAADGYQLWSERFDREMHDVFAIQDEIAAAVLQKLRVTLLGVPEGGARGRHTDDVKAYELYLRGRFFWNQRGAGLRKGLEYFQQAVERDPGYALAHAGMADAFAMIGFWSGTKQPGAYVQGKATAKRALELNPELAEAHACLGFIAIYHTWDWALAERELLRAIELEPRYVEGHLYYSTYLGYFKGDWEGALTHLRQAQDVDPLSITVMAQIGGQLANGGRLEEALTQLDRTLEFAPTFVLAHWFRSMTCRKLGRPEAAVVALEPVVAANPDQTHLVGELALAYVEAGREERAHAILVEGMLGDSEPFYAAAVCAALGNTDEAYDWLEVGFERRDPMVGSIRRYPGPLALDREDPRFQDLVKRLGIP